MFKITHELIKDLKENIKFQVFSMLFLLQGRMTLIIAKVRHSDFGDYHCIARNDLAVTRGLVSVYGKLLRNYATNSYTKGWLWLKFTFHLCIRKR